MTADVDRFMESDSLLLCCSKCNSQTSTTFFAETVTVLLITENAQIDMRERELRLISWDDLLSARGGGSSG